MLKPIINYQIKKLQGKYFAMTCEDRWKCPTMIKTLPKNHLNIQEIEHTSVPGSLRYELVGAILHIPLCHCVSHPKKAAGLYQI